MLTDAALARSIGGEIKWLYNSARRLGRPVRRSLDDAVWWRMVHHLAVGLGVPMVDAARAADTLLAAGMNPGRVRVSATRDESVAISVDLARFHDAAALALACALHMAVPKARGRPRIRTEPDTRPAFTAQEMATIVQLRSMADADRLGLALRIPAFDADANHTGQSVVSALAQAGVPFAVAGNAAAAFHGAPWHADSLDLCADVSVRHGAVLARILNTLEAKPRGAPVREGFEFDSSLVRAVPMLALRVGSLPLNVTSAIDGLGEYSQIEDLCVQVPLECVRVRVITLEALLRSPPPARATADPLLQMRWRRLGALHEPRAGTR